MKIIQILIVIILFLSCKQKEEEYCYTCAGTATQFDRHAAPNTGQSFPINYPTKCGITTIEGTAYEKSLNYCKTDQFLNFTYYCQVVTCTKK